MEIKIRKEIEINFYLNNLIKNCILEMEKIYDKSLKINKDSELFKELSQQFYSLTLELEGFVLGSWRSGQFSEEEGNLLLYKYNFFD
ncbi:MAG: hypothetical protein KGV57_04885 [Fusobacterium sp.]|nr:hypothetical protein [Fusobacterium sp.]